MKITVYKIENWPNSKRVYSHDLKDIQTLKDLKLRDCYGYDEIRDTITGDFWINFPLTKGNIKILTQNNINLNLI